MGDVSVVGCVGALIVATRGVAGPGEVLLTVRGWKEAYLAWSDRPLPRGTEVLVIDIRGARRRQGSVPGRAEPALDHRRTP